MTPFHNFQKLTDHIGQHFQFTQDQKDAAEIVLDVLNKYLVYRYQDNSVVSFTLISRIDTPALIALLADVDIELSSKEYTKTPKPGLLDRLNVFKGNQNDD
jgi:hypothetical protein